MRTLLRICAIFLVMVFAVAALFGYEAWKFLDTPGDANSKEIYFDITPGTHLQAIAKDLQHKGLITDARKFAWLARYKDYGDKIQSGRFALNSGWKPMRILDTLVNGKAILYRVTIPEGLTWWQTGRILEDAGLARFDDFRQVITDPEFLRHHGIPFASAEGFLMPDTYFLKKPFSPMPGDNSQEDYDGARKIREEWKAQAKDVAGRMVDNFWRKSTPLWPQGAGNPDAYGIIRPKRTDLIKWVTLASIVEKETGIDSERPRVSGVYENRLRNNMLLQADPTIIYGLGPNFSGSLKRTDLENTANPYNTYARPGLPPGPISSFGVAALSAAINPEKHDFFYFVAKTDGGAHAFSRTLEEHNQAVREYRRQKK